MKTDAIYKFKCGDIVVHKTSKMNRYLIVATGTMTAADGQTSNIYLISFDTMGSLGRTYITEFEIELYDPRR
jgi:hypothetical protein